MTASAQVPIFETNSSIIGSNISTAGSTLKDLVQGLYEWAQKLLTERLRRQLLDMLVDQMVDFINDGSSPKIISDWQGFLRNANITAGIKISNQIGNVDICPEFKDVILDSLGATNSGSGEPGGALECSKPDQDSDENSGWGGLLLSTRPENSFIPVYVFSHDIKQQAASEASKAAELEGVSGGGFLSDKKDGVIVTPGSVIKDLASKAVGSEIDYVLNADSLETYVNAIINSMFNSVLADGLAIVSPTTGNTNDIYNYVPDANALGAIDAAKYDSERTQTISSITKAIKDREAGQKFFDLSGSGLDLSEADTILAALEYLRGELLRPQDVTDLISACGDNRFGTPTLIRTDVIPLITDMMNNMADAYAAIEIADDNNPNFNDPTSPTFAVLDGDASDNLDINGQLAAYKTELESLSDNNEENRSSLLRIKTTIGSSFELDASKFKSDIEKSLETIAKAKDLLTEKDDFAGALAACTKHRSPAGTHSSITGTLPFSYPANSWTTTPAQPFPWE